VNKVKSGGRSLLEGVRVGSDTAEVDGDTLLRILRDENDHLPVGVPGILVRRDVLEKRRGGGRSVEENVPRRLREVSNIPRGCRGGTIKNLKGASGRGLEAPLRHVVTTASAENKVQALGVVSRVLEALREREIADLRVARGAAKSAARPGNTRALTGEEGLSSEFRNTALGRHFANYDLQKCFTEKCSIRFYNGSVKCFNSRKPQKTGRHDVALRGCVY